MLYNVDVLRKEVNMSKNDLTINCCGVQLIRERTYHTKRVRDDYSFMFVSSGKATMITDGKETEVTAGHGMFYMPGAYQDFIYRKEDKSVNKWIHFSGALGKILDGEPARCIKVAHAYEFENNLDRLIKASNCTNKNNLLCDAYMRALIAIIAESETGQRSDTVENRLFRVLDYINQNIGHEIDLDECAKNCYVSRDRFNHLFKENVGISPAAYIRRATVERAKQLLCDIGMTVNECAETLGYSDPNYFCRLFRAEIGTSPSQYKKQNKE